MNTSGPQGWKTSASECEYFKISDDISSDNEKDSDSDNDTETESESSSGYNSGKEEKPRIFP